jgi:hypothetical protein
VDWKITDTGDVWCYAAMAVTARGADGTDYPSPGVGMKLDQGETSSGTIAISTGGKEADSVFVSYRRPGE